MELSLVHELQYFATAILYGVVILLAYDVLRVLRVVIKHNWLWTAVQDILFWIVAGILVFQMMYWRNDGRIRFYAIFALVAGMLIYHTAVEDRLVHLFVRIIGILLKPLRTGVRKAKKFSTKIEKKWFTLLKYWKKKATIAIKKP